MIATVLAIVALLWCIVAALAFCSHQARRDQRGPREWWEKW